MSDPTNNEDQDGPENPTIKRAVTEIGNKEQRLLRVDEMYVISFILEGKCTVNTVP